MKLLVAIVQGILHYLGILAIIFGVIAFAFGNHQRGSELLVSGLVFIVIKYAIGFIFLGLSSAVLKQEASDMPASGRYDQLITTLNTVKHGTAPTHQKKLISTKLINNAQISEIQRHDLLDQLEEAYDESSEK